MADTFHCSVVTPERAVLDAEASFVALPGATTARSASCRGARRCSPSSAPASCASRSAGGRSARYFVDGGFAQMVDDKLTLLTEEAQPKDEIDAAQAARELESALALPAQDEGQTQARDKALARARALVRVAG